MTIDPVLCWTFGGVGVLSVSFTTGKGEKITFASASGWVTAPESGREVTVLYDPASPKDAEISSFRTLWLFPVITAIMGLPFLLVGLPCLA